MKVIPESREADSSGTQMAQKQVPALPPAFAGVRPG